MNKLNKTKENKIEIELLIEKQMSDFTKHITTEYILKQRKSY